MGMVRHIILKLEEKEFIELLKTKNRMSENEGIHISWENFIRYLYNFTKKSWESVRDETKIKTNRKRRKSK